MHYILVVFQPILNGKEAEKADPDAHSSDDDTPASAPIHRFTKRSDLVIERKLTIQQHGEGTQRAVLYCTVVTWFIKC